MHKAVPSSERIPRIFLITRAWAGETYPEPICLTDMKKGAAKSMAAPFDVYVLLLFSKSLVCLKTKLGELLGLLEELLSAVRIHLVE